jgi:Putative addiction module component
MTSEQISTEATKLPTLSPPFGTEESLETSDGEDAVELSTEWLTEIRRRFAIIESGAAQMLPAEKLFASALERLRKCS